MKYRKKKRKGRIKASVLKKGLATRPTPSTLYPANPTSRYFSVKEGQRSPEEHDRGVV